MGGDGGFVLPLFVEEQPPRVFAIAMDIVRDAAGLGAGPGAMLDAQRDNLFGAGRERSGDGGGDDDHNSSVARVVFLDMK